MTKALCPRWLQIPSSWQYQLLHKLEFCVWGFLEFSFFSGHGTHDLEYVRQVSSTKPHPHFYMFEKQTSKGRLEVVRHLPNTYRFSHVLKLRNRMLYITTKMNISKIPLESSDIPHHCICLVNGKQRWQWEEKACYFSWVTVSSTPSLSCYQ